MRLIDADALADHLKSFTGMFTDELGFVLSLEAVVRGIESAPTVDAVEVVHGRWDKNWSGDNVVYCDQCYMPHDWATSYCSSCGAKMDGDGNG